MIDGPRPILKRKSFVVSGVESDRASAKVMYDGFAFPGEREEKKSCWRRLTWQHRTEKRPSVPVYNSLD